MKCPEPVKAQAMRGGSVLNGEGPQVDAPLVVGLLDGDLQRMQIVQCSRRRGASTSRLLICSASISAVVLGNGKIMALCADSVKRLP